MAQQRTKQQSKPVQPVSKHMAKTNKWTVGLCALGAISLAGVAQAEEKQLSVAALTPTTLSGFVDTSAHWNLGTGNLDLPAYTPNGVSGGKKADGFNLDMVEITLGKAADTDAGKWSAGYNATMVYGPDAVGYNPSIAGSMQDFALKDTYVELRAPIGNGLDFKLGTYTEILGYEVFEAGNNPNYTRSYGYEIEPTQMTGFLTSYQVSSVVSAQFGICDAWSAGVNARSFQTTPGGTPMKAESFKTYMGAVTLTAPKSTGFLEGSTLVMGAINGYDALNMVTKTSLYIGGTMNTPLKPLKVGAAYDYVMLGDNTIVGVRNNSGYQAAAAGYLLVQATEKLALNTRVDYFTQSGYLEAASVAAGTGLAKRALGVTETLQYDLWKNVMTRAEFRWDHALDASGPYMTTPGPTTGRDNAFLLALNVIYKF